MTGSPPILARLARKVIDRTIATSSARAARAAIGLCRSLIRERGEASSAQAARSALAAYVALDDEARSHFFDALARDFSPSPDGVSDAARAYQKEPSPANLQRLQDVVEPARQELFRRLNMAPGGTAALVDMRLKVLLGLDDHAQWRAIDNDLRHLLRSWFNRGFLTLERIDWRTPAVVLEKLIAYEAVHAIQGWEDLRRRLQADRRCFAFFHPQLPDEPIIFIEVALTRGLSGRVQPLLDVTSPVSDATRANCATFYSITNCQEGLRGISFGNFLIKQVAEELKRELPGVRRFATLSPVPGFRSWLSSRREKLLAGPHGDTMRTMFERLAEPEWFRTDDAAIQTTLSELAAYYLTRAKRGSEPLDAVARFHLGNGASLDRINWLGDTSVHGMARSYGVMVNYVYRLAEVERNHELFVNQRRVVAANAIDLMAERAAEWLGDERPARAAA